MFVICADKLADGSTASSPACQREGCWAQPCLCPWTGLKREQNSAPCLSGADELHIKAMLLDSGKHLTLVPVLSNLIIAAVTVRGCCGTAAGHCQTCEFTPLLSHPDCFRSAEMSSRTRMWRCA